MDLGAFVRRVEPGSGDPVGAEAARRIRPIGR
jgi:hypothetical protein